MTKYLGYEDELSVSSLLSSAHSFGAESVVVTNSCGDSEHFYFDNRPDDVEDAVLELLDGGDMDYRFSFYKGDSEHETHLGTFYVCLGNDDGSAVYEKKKKKWCDAIWDAIA